MKVRDWRSKEGWALACKLRDWVCKAVILRFLCITKEHLRTFAFTTGGSSTCVCTWTLAKKLHNQDSAAGVEALNDPEGKHETHTATRGHNLLAGLFITQPPKAQKPLQTADIPNIPSTTTTTTSTTTTTTHPGIRRGDAPMRHHRYYPWDVTRLLADTRASQPDLLQD